MVCSSTLPTLMVVPLGIIISAGLRRTISWEMTGEENSTDMNIFWGDEQSAVS